LDATKLLLGITLLTTTILGTLVTSPCNITTACSLFFIKTGEYDNYLSLGEWLEASHIDQQLRYADQDEGPLYLTFSNFNYHLSYLDQLITSDDKINHVDSP
jgi:hypothetical protein